MGSALSWGALFHLPCASSIAPVPRSALLDQTTTSPSPFLFCSPLLLSNSCSFFFFAWLAVVFAFPPVPTSVYKLGLHFCTKAGITLAKHTDCIKVDHLFVFFVQFFWSEPPLHQDIYLRFFVYIGMYIVSKWLVAQISTLYLLCTTFSLISMYGPGHPTGYNSPDKAVLCPVIHLYKCDFSKWPRGDLPFYILPLFIF